MNPAAHFLFGALLACILINFGVELPRRRGRHGSSPLGRWRIALFVLILGSVAAFPQASRYFGDRKLDSGPVFNLFLFHDILNQAGYRLRLGEGIMDPPVTMPVLALVVMILLMGYLRSSPSPGWHALWRDVAYFSVILACLVAVRWVVSENSYRYMPKTYVYVNWEPYVVIRDDVFSRTWVPVVGLTRDKALAVARAYEAVQAANWQEPGDAAVTTFLHGSQLGVQTPPLEYQSLLVLISVLRQIPGLAPQEDVNRMIAAGTLPETDIPRVLQLGIPVSALLLCLATIYPALGLRREG